MLGGSAEAVAAFETYLRGLIAAKRAEPADDLITAMVAARDEDDRLSEDELTSLAFLTLLAGYENAVNLIGNCILLLLQRPHLVAEVRGDERLRRAAVEETLRWPCCRPRWRWARCWSSFPRSRWPIRPHRRPGGGRSAPARWTNYRSS